MEDLIKRLRNDGHLNLAIYLQVTWQHYKQYLEEKRETGLAFSHIKMDTILDILEMEKLITADEYNQLNHIVMQSRKERGM